MPNFLLRQQREHKRTLEIKSTEIALVDLNKSERNDAENVSGTHRGHENCSKNGILESLNKKNAGRAAGILAVVKNSLQCALVNNMRKGRKMAANRERETVFPAVENTPNIFRRSETLV